MTWPGSAPWRGCRAAPRGPTRRPGRSGDAGAPAQGLAEPRAAAILDAYREGIAGAGTEDGKLEVIGRTAQALQRSHVFSDGNTRTALFNALNRMLLENGLAPAVLPEPRAAAGFTLEQFVAAIRESQQRFQALVP
jgi:hypothetical protein